MTISDFITQTMPQLMVAAVNSKSDFHPQYLYNRLQDVAVSMLKDGHLYADDEYLSTLAVQMIDAYNGDITVKDLCLEMNTILMPGNRVNWHKVVIELNLGPYTVTENDAYFEGDERHYQIIKSHDYDYCYNHEK